MTHLSMCITQYSRSEGFVTAMTGKGVAWTMRLPDPSYETTAKLALLDHCAAHGWTMLSERHTGVVSITLRHETPDQPCPPPPADYMAIEMEK